MVSGAVLVSLWELGRGHLPPADATIRDKSFIWPGVDTVVGLAVVGVLVLVHRRSVGAKRGDRAAAIDAGRWAGIALLTCETVFLVLAGAPLAASTKAPFFPTPAVRALQAHVGSSLVGLGEAGCFLPPGLGIEENTQSAFDVRELAFYDPSASGSYFSSWTDLTGRRAGYPEFSIYCPGITSASLARLYGVRFVVESIRAPGGPQGSVFVTQLGEVEDLYRIPGAAAATLTPLPATGRLPAVTAQGTPVAVTHASPSSWKVVTKANSAQVLRLRLTDAPGWHATIDGRPLALTPFAGIMLQAEVPRGDHTVELHYWPTTFSLGLVLAGGAAVIFLVILAAAKVRRRSSPPPSTAAGRARPTPGSHTVRGSQ